jgi:FkbM family methyltransferase
MFDKHVLNKVLGAAKRSDFLFRPNYYYYRLLKLLDPGAFKGESVASALNYLHYSQPSIRWFKDRGDSTHLLNHDLNQDSMVLDVGGYQGSWSEQISLKYNPNIFVFEPVPEFYAAIVDKFKHNPKISVFNFGLSDRNGLSKMTVQGMGSSIYLNSQNMIGVELRDITGFLIDSNIHHIDLIKINIEGGEYPLLNKMINDGVIDICEGIMIQFHESYLARRQAHALRLEIVRAIETTHTKVFSYPFVWEGWKRTCACSPPLKTSPPSG